MDHVVGSSPLVCERIRMITEHARLGIRKKITREHPENSVEGSPWAPDHRFRALQPRESAAGYLTCVRRKLWSSTSKVISEGGLLRRGSPVPL